MLRRAWIFATPARGLAYWLGTRSAFRVPLPAINKVAEYVRIRLVYLSVPEVGLEPTNLAVHDFESCAYTNSAIPAQGT